MCVLFMGISTKEIALWATNQLLLTRLLLAPIRQGMFPVVMTI